MSTIKVGHNPAWDPEVAIVIPSRVNDLDLSAKIAGDLGYKHVTLACGDDGTADPHPERRYFVDDPHAPMPPLTVQRAHKQRRWWTQARTELRNRGAIVGGPIRIPWGPRRGRFSWAKRALWKAVAS